MPAFLAASVLLALATAGAGEMRVPADDALRVRAESQEVRALIDGAMLRSATIRDLVSRLSCSDVIVYVEITSSPQVPTARTKLVTTASGTRFLRIGINITLGQRDRAAFLGHELQHAVEIAEHVEVRDDGGVRRLYLAIGHSRGGDSYETDAARNVEWNVRSELRTKIGG